MTSAKDILIKPIKASAANALIKKIHYSGKVVSNSILHLGVFLDGRLEGAMQFGSSIDKRKTQKLVTGTLWNEFIELNRMAFSDRLPRNSESRALGVATRLIKKNYPQIKWIISFSDGCQCGDGTIYRASGFILTAIKENSRLMRLSDGTIVHGLTLEAAKPTPFQIEMRKRYGNMSGSVSSLLKQDGAEKVKGYQLRYLYFIDKEAIKNLTVPVLPFSEIDKIGAGMYKGANISISERRVKKAN